MDTGWPESAAAWIADMGERGDFAREHVLDGPMLARIRGRGFKTALDVGCGEGRAEALAFPDASFDLVVSYLTLIDIADIGAAIPEMARVLRPGGALLIANLTSFSTAGLVWDPGTEHSTSWRRDADGNAYFAIDRYLEERAEWVGWRGIRIKNWHRPLSSYMALLLGAGLELRHFAEPAPTGGDPERAHRYGRVPWFLIMEWEKP